MESNDFVTILAAIGTLLNTLGILYFSFRKNKKEVKRLDAEAESEIVDAANLNLEGARVSVQILLDRINELKEENEREAAELKEALEMEKNTRIKELAQERKAREDDARYFRRRIKDLEREYRDYRSWAAKLVKQVVEAGRIPVPFEPSISDSDFAQAIRPDLETGPNPAIDKEEDDK